jgi:HSP20 family molecular chaperone IbpA
VNLDVQQFKPEDLNVKTVDNYVVVEGKHEEKQDEHGFISRHFVRRYLLPEGAKAEQVNCNLSSDGVLQIEVAREVKELPTNGRAIPIMQSGEPAMPKNKAQIEGSDSQMQQ